ncbi:sensor histidine kinase KdpD [Mesorhizobium sp. YR577]|uniref:sensor histidine kinase n=1 Tax=Mesorhizobium sp. YR577 TaxID=1884373 RepID=UPI0008E0AB84|nr:sensor histidine kinase KdpD [Mesorhizobium sp. YR577]SFT41360.1 two-component system, OmpR family, sensor histidine kinase KdpD [Mesorhizobium sp. YR577]
MPDDSDRRPSPDALLEAAERELRGKLRIFLGAAPGVGKTFEMLLSGRARQAEGVDVVIGVVETHGRKETEALLKGFEIIPRVPVPYKERALDEMDIDAILMRRPQLVLVDELAHTNAPGSRHPKRYLDIEELLAAGIDVYTTVNIQHVESLNDIVAQITRVRVRETVPDSFIDRADDIEVIDLTPGDLIERLKQGKVYMPRTAKAAVENYFSPGNLTALRELALRRTAQRVDEQLVSHMRENAISGPWAAGERVLVCIDEAPRAAAMVRYGRRLAERLRAPWSVVTVETTHAARLTEAERDRIASALRLAESLGAEAATLPGRTVAEEIMRYARERNVTHIIVGSSDKARWREWIEGSVTHDLIRIAGDISVHVISGREVAPKPPRGSVQDAGTTGFSFRPYLVSLGIIGIALICAFALRQLLDVANIGVVFLMGVLTSALWFGLRPAIFASVIGAITFNFFFLPPLYTFDIGDSESIVTFVFFLVVSVIASNLSARVRGQAIAARQRARMNEDLYMFSKKLAGTATLDDVLWATAFQIASMLKVRVVLLLPEEGRITVKAGYPPEDTLDEADLAAAKWTWENDRPAGRSADTLPGAKRLFLPVRTARGAIAVVGIDDDRQGPMLTPERRRLMDALTDQAALAIERVHLVEDLDNAKLAVEADRLRSALLTSISHDLKTPLAAIMGAAGTLKEFSGALDAPTKDELLGSVLDESERLNRFIANLLDMTKLESGAISPNFGMHDLNEIVGSALSRAKKILGSHQIEVDLPPNLPMLRVDPVLFEQVLFNLFDNAAKYSPAASRIRIQSFQGEKSLTIQILDEGPGIPADELEDIFGKFTRARKGDSVPAGTGLGLAICRGFIEAMGGTIVAGNRTDRPGAVFTIRMKLPAGQIEGTELS